MLSKSILSYRGPLSFSTIDWLLSEFKVAVQEHDISFKTYKKMISVSTCSWPYYLAPLHHLGKVVQCRIQSLIEFIFFNFFVQS